MNYRQKCKSAKACCWHGEDLLMQSRLLHIQAGNKQRTKGIKVDDDSLTL